ncbi:D-2-hydroxyacid dehydrogenase [Clostridia bacterium]|nr:D-2-hydroxyacid dehydrogenase [Clostridia bacterium]
MAKILVTDGMDAKAAAALRELGHEVVEEFYAPEVLAEKVKNADAMVVRSATKVPAAILDSAAEAGQLKVVIRAGVGVDNIDCVHAKEVGIAVRNTPAASSSAVAELALAHMFAVARHISAANVTMCNGEWNKKAYKGVELSGKTLGLIGFGRIARSLAGKASALGMKVIYTDIVGKFEGYDEYQYMEKEDILKNADFVSLHIPYIKEMGATIAADEIAMMKDGSYLINCARGGVVDEAALVDALKSGKLAGAAVDVFEKEPTPNAELINLSNVSCTPHIGASTKEAQARIGEEIVSIIKEYF